MARACPRTEAIVRLGKTRLHCAAPHALSPPTVAHIRGPYLAAGVCFWTVDSAPQVRWSSSWGALRAGTERMDTGVEEGGDARDTLHGCWHVVVVGIRRRFGYVVFLFGSFDS